MGGYVSSRRFPGSQLRHLRVVRFAGRLPAVPSRLVPPVALARDQGEAQGTELFRQTMRDVDRRVESLWQHVADTLEALLSEINHHFDWLWEQIVNEFEQRYEVTNLGAATVSGTDTTGTFTFAAAHEEPDTSYYVIAVPITLTGSPSAGASRIRSVSKSTSAVTLTVEAAPGAGTSVAFDVAVCRIPIP